VPPKAPQRLALQSAVSTNSPVLLAVRLKHRFTSKGVPPAPLLVSLTNSTPAAPGSPWVLKLLRCPRRMVQTCTPSPLPALAPAAAAVTSTADSGGASEQEVALRRLTHLQQLYRIYKARRYRLFFSSSSSRG